MNYEYIVRSIQRIVSHMHVQLTVEGDVCGEVDEVYPDAVVLCCLLIGTGDDRVCCCAYGSMLSK